MGGESRYCISRETQQAAWVFVAERGVQTQQKPNGSPTDWGIVGDKQHTLVEHVSKIRQEIRLYFEVYQKREGLLCSGV